MLEIAILFVVGSLGGLFSGFLGIGGGVILIPLLIYWGEYSIKDATAISVVFIVFASISGIMGHRKNIQLETGVWIGVSSIVGAYFGSLLCDKISDQLLSYIFVFVVSLAAFMLLFPTRKGYETPDDVKKHVLRKDLAVFIGLLKGILTGLLGVGGGFIVIPLMIYCLKIKTLVAIGTSLVITLLSGFSTLIFKASIVSTIEITKIFWIVLGAVISAQLGAYIARRVRPALIRKMLLIVLVSILVRMAWGV